ncbi:hypothetical protein ABFS82_14G303300 [Erythranthe guttata]
MANLDSAEGSGARDASGQSSESTFEINIKTLDSRICSFHVDKNIVVLAFKEKIASQIGVPVGQQRLIFRGKVLKDDHLLSEYNVENGDTLHLVERQLQPAPGPNTVEATSSNGNRGVQDSTAGVPRNRIGQIAHSVVLGTLNVGDAGEGAGPDLSRVIGAVLSSIGIGNLAGGVQPGFQTSHGNDSEGSQVNSSNRSQGGNQSIPSPYPMQTPIGAAVALPSLNLPIPDSLNTLTEFMNRMESAFLQNGTQQNQSPTASGSIPTPQLPTNTRGSTVEALTIVLRHAERLLRDHAASALSHTAGRLDQEGGSNDSAVRGQVQTESMRLGVSMQHLGALFLELGRTILTLRMGQSPGESFVNSGPAVYISPSGPNPIMVQPFPLQTSSLFGNSSGVAPNLVATNPIGVGNVPRNVNIHIHTGAALAPMVSTLGNRPPSGEETQRDRASRTESGESGQTRVLSGLNVIASRPTIPISSAVQPGTGVSQASQPNAISSIVAEIDRQIRSLTDNRQNEHHTPSEGLVDDARSHQSNLSSSRVGDTSQTSSHNTIMEDQKVKTQTEPSSSSEGGPHHTSSASEYAERSEAPPKSSQGNDNPDGPSSVPLGLGLGGLQPKKPLLHLRRRASLPRAQAKSGDGANSSGQDKKTREVGQQVLQSLASSFSSRGDANPPPVQQPSNFARGGVMGNVPPPSGQNADLADAMSQVLQSPSLDGLLAGVSQQTGVGSPDMLRNMFQQFTQNPAMMNTVSQIAQQFDGNDIGSMFSGSGSGGQGGGFDISRMMQQMMPLLTQTLGGVSPLPQQSPPSEPLLLGSSSRRDIPPVINDYPQGIDLQQVVQRLEGGSSSEEVFRSLVDRAAHLSGSSEESAVNELSSQAGLAQEFMEMLRLDVSRRLQNEGGS